MATESKRLIAILETKLKHVFVLDTESVTLCYGREKCWWKLDDNKFSFFFIRRCTLLFVNSLGLANHESVAFGIY
jgi:hypothetical protein